MSSDRSDAPGVPARFTDRMATVIDQHKIEVERLRERQHLTLINPVLNATLVSEIFEEVNPDKLVDHLESSEGMARFARSIQQPEWDEMKVGVLLETFEEQRATISMAVGNLRSGIDTMDRTLLVVLSGGMVACIAAILNPASTPTAISLASSGLVALLSITVWAALLRQKLSDGVGRLTLRNQRIDRALEITKSQLDLLRKGADRDPGRLRAEEQS